KTPLVLAHVEAENRDPPLQAQPRQDEDGRHLRAGGGRPKPIAAGPRERPVDRREADVREGEEDPRERADVRQGDGRGGGRGLAGRRPLPRLERQEKGRQGNRGGERLAPAAGGRCPSGPCSPPPAPGGGPARDR